MTSKQQNPLAKIALACSLGLLVAGNASARIPDHPTKLKYDDRQIEVPEAADYRHQLAGGNVAYIVPDESLPLVRISIRSRAGGYIADPAQAALPGMTATMLREGGTEDLTPEELDERLDFLATEIGVSIDDTSSAISLDTLAVNLDESLDLMFDMLTEPRFDADRLAVNQSRALEGMRRRNDDTRAIEPRVWSDLMVGSGFFANNPATEAEVNAVDAAAMRALSDRIFANGQLVVAVAGAVEAGDIVERLNRQLARLPAGGDLPPIPDDTQPAPPGLYGVNKSDVNQTRVRMGHPGPRHGHEDEPAIDVMNEILGGGGFTSRVVNRVRSDEGLAYSAGTAYTLGRWWPGQFLAAFQSKNPSVPQAVGIVLEEIRRIQEQPVSDQELSTAQESVVAVLNELYSNASRRASRFASDDLNQEAADYWATFEQRVRSVDVADVQRVAQEWLNPGQLRILLTGKLDEAMAGDGEHGSIESVTGMELQQIPLRDPMTLEPLPLEPIGGE